MATNIAGADLDLMTRLSRPARLIGVAALALVLLIPLRMVESVVWDRHNTYQSVVQDIAGSWSGDQRVAGPVLVIPYTERVAIKDELITPEGEKKFTQRWEIRQRRAVVLPDSLTIRGDLVPELRRRGIYRVQVYNADLVISGAFRNLESTVAGLSSADQLEEIDWSGSVVGFGLSDPRGIVRVDGFHVGGHTVELRPGTTLGGMLPQGFHAPIGESASGGFEFSLPIVIRGSGSLRFLPLGETTRATLRSSWSHPSFIGDALPVDRVINDDGFSAEWTIPLLNRSYPQAWRIGATVAIDEIEAGVRLFEPVALYDLVTRSVKYGLLFIALTFLTLGLIEYTTDARFSFVQFLLIGVALALFFLLLIALAEHMGFARAYILASSTMIVIITLYCAAILRNRSIALSVGGVLTAIYGVLYLILKAEDFALLGGTLLLLVGLLVTMYVTRQIHNPRVGIPPRTGDELGGVVVS